jgi:hypothetical protein
MRKRNKKTETLQARIPYADHEIWRRICADKKITSSDALRSAVSIYAENLGYKISLNTDDQV